MPLSKLDIKFICKDRRIRRMGYHTHKVEQFQIRDNEYVKFLNMCVGHALKVGDNKIANIVMNMIPLENFKEGMGDYDD